MSLVICWQAITAGWLSGYHRVINTDQCTCLSSNTISFNTQLSSVHRVCCLIPTNRKLKCSFRAVLSFQLLQPWRLSESFICVQGSVLTFLKRNPSKIRYVLTLFLFILIMRRFTILFLCKKCILK